MSLYIRSSLKTTFYKGEKSDRPKKKREKGNTGYSFRRKRKKSKKDKRQNSSCSYIPSSLKTHLPSL